ncbi:MAG: hypothetical protein JSV62_15660 [Promethearchaeota archaeon]|nr:MAG: hypothetical protein JSV62_15660 [Candidatus Lokiarchaeota archaeon]
MVDNHSYSFFGQKVGLIIQSASKNEPFMFFRLIKCKNDGSWEKPSSGEGKIIKFSLEEMVWILRVLNKEVNSWSSYHTFKENKTQISFKWEDGEKNKLWIHIGSYSKVLEYSQFTILEMLLKHMLKEKIEYATVSTISKKNNSDIISNIIIEEEIITDLDHKKNKELKSDSNKKKSISGAIKNETNKAVLIQFDNGSEVWVPKSGIHSEFNSSKNIIQKFTIDSWILDKNKIVS